MLVVQEKAEKQALEQAEARPRRDGIKERGECMTIECALLPVEAATVL